MQLRPYQEDARRSAHEAWKDFNRILTVMPTGTGKTIVFANIAKDIVEAGGRVLIMAHRGELLDQAADKIMKATGLACAVEKAEQESHNALERITVGSVQSLMSQKRLERFSEDHFSHIIIDEAHHALADSYQASVRYFGDAKVLGVTATPDRNDKKNLGSYFETMSYEYSLIAAIRDGYLAKIRALSVPLQIDISKVSMQSGDFKASDLDDALAPYMDQIAVEMAERCADRKSLVFVPLVATAERFAEVLRSKGFRAAWIAGNHPERAEILQNYAAGEYDVLVNSMLLTEGYDDPATDCIVCLRPTKSRPLYAQIIGRGTRIHQGKEDLLLLDFLWLTEKHELCRPANLVSDSDAMANVLKKATEAAGAEGMLLDDEAMAEAKKEVVKEREAALAKELRKQRAKKARLVDPLQWAVSVNAEDLTDYQPDFGWEMSPPSKNQLGQLEKSGISADAVQSAGMASKLLDRLEMRKQAGFATPRQVRCLERYGFKHVGEMPFAEANKIITRISGNGWRLPHDLQNKINEQRKAS